MTRERLPEIWSDRPRPPKQPKQPKQPKPKKPGILSWRRLVIVVLYLTALVASGAILARWVSATAGAGLVVLGFLLLGLVAFRSRNRWADGSLEPGMGEVWAAGGEWDVGAGGDGGGGGD